MPETLVRFQTPIAAADSRLYEARACGAETPTGLWEGWIEFVPLDGTAPIRSARETTQPNRADALYWASGLTPVYLEGALTRALDPIHLPLAHGSEPSLFPRPRTVPSPPSGNAATPTSVIDPFAAYKKGETILRRQLSALSAWHLVNVIVEYELTDEPHEVLSRLPAPALIARITTAVEAQLRLGHARAR